MNAMIRESQLQLQKWFYGNPTDSIEFLELEGMTDEIFDEIEEAYRSIQKTLCRVGGHFVMDDHCGKPEHRYCINCEERTPNEKAEL